MSSFKGDLQRNTARQLASMRDKLYAQSGKWEGTDNFQARELARLSEECDRVRKDLILAEMDGRKKRQK